MVLLVLGKVIMPLNGTNEKLQSKALCENQREDS